LIVSVCAPAPAVTEEGETVVILGTGLGEGAGELLDPPPPHPNQLRMSVKRNRTKSRVDFLRILLFGMFNLLMISCSSESFLCDFTVENGWKLKIP
jgi:hypothetical protein